MCNRKSQCPDPKINIACIFDAANQRISLPESNITSHLQNGCLEYYYSFLLGKRPIFRVRTAVSFRECFPAISRYGLTTEQAQNVEIAATTPFGPKKKKHMANGTRGLTPGVFWRNFGDPKMRKGIGKPMLSYCLLNNDHQYTDTLVSVFPTDTHRQISYAFHNLSRVIPNKL